LGLDKGYELKGHSDPVTHVKFSENSNDENTLISCSSDKTVKLWDVRINKNVKSEKTKGGCKNLAWNYDSSIFAFSNKDDDMISFYDLRKFQIIKQIQFKNKISEFEFDKSNSLLLVTSKLGSIILIDAYALDSEPLAEIEGHYPQINTININKSNTIFATGAADALICLWDMEELLSYKVIKKGEIPIQKIAFSHDSELIAAIYEGNNLDIFDVNTTECIYSVLTENPQYSLAWNPNSYILAYCGDDKNRNNQDEANIHLLSLA
jgi:THO complex subunit 3